MAKLSINDHSRDSLGLTYVYPVRSRRAGGLSIGVNLNPNNACNWACVYCQVPDLTRGIAPVCDLEQLKQELRGVLEQHRSGSLAKQFSLDQNDAVIRDIAISGNGEPTSCPNFSLVTEAIGEIAESFGLLGSIKLTVITNGSLMHHPEVQKGLRHWATLGGEAWFKFDRGSSSGIHQINGARLSINRVLNHMKISISLLPTWIQTCMVTLDNAPPSDRDIEDYLGVLETLVRTGSSPQGVMLYGLARPSQQPEASRLGNVDGAIQQDLAQRIQALGLDVKVSI